MAKECANTLPQPHGDVWETWLSNHAKYGMRMNLDLKHVEMEQLLRLLHVA